MFARIAEEFKAIRKDTPPGPARDRIDQLIRLNQETMDVMKRNLSMRTADLQRHDDM